MTTYTITVSEETVKEALVALAERESFYRVLAQRTEDAGLDIGQWSEWSDQAKQAHDELLQALAGI